MYEKQTKRHVRRRALDPNCTTQREKWEGSTTRLSFTLSFGDIPWFDGGAKYGAVIGHKMRFCMCRV